jgi:hypothetical protein
MDPRSRPEFPDALILPLLLTASVLVTVFERSAGPELGDDGGVARISFNPTPCNRSHSGIRTRKYGAVIHKKPTVSHAANEACNIYNKIYRLTYNALRSTLCV